MKKTETKYYCDVCGEEVAEKELKQIKIPIKYYYDREVLNTNESLEICDECNEALLEIIRKRFAEIALVWCDCIKVERLKYKVRADE